MFSSIIIKQQQHHQFPVIVVPILSNQQRQNHHTTTTSNNSNNNSSLSSSTTNPNISSFLHRLLLTARNSCEKKQHQLVFDKWMKSSSSIDEIFSQCDIRYHSIRVPVQRRLAQERAQKVLVTNSKKKGKMITKK